MSDVVNSEREIVFVVGKVRGEMTWEELERKIEDTLYPDDKLISKELECKVHHSTYRFCYSTDKVRRKI